MKDDGSNQQERKAAQLQIYHGTSVAAGTAWQSRTGLFSRAQQQQQQQAQQSRTFPCSYRPQYELV